MNIKFTRKMSVLMQMCRTCLREGCDYVRLGNGKESYRYKLMICVPEIDADILKNPALCGDCAAKLDEAYRFKRTCIESEKKINENLTLKINLENALKPNADLQISNILLRGKYVNEKKRKHTENLLSQLKEESEYYVAIKQECDSDGNDVPRYKISRSAELVLPSDKIEDVRPKSDFETNFFKQVQGQDGNQKADYASIVLPADVVIKEEPDFFYSGYDSDSMENNNVDVAINQIVSKNILDESLVDVGEIFTEHSYSANSEATEFSNNDGAAAPRDRVETDVHFNKVACNVCKELYDEQFMAIHMEVHKTVKTVTDAEPAVDGSYLSVKVDAERKSMCRYCSKIFNDGASLYDHVRQAHGKDSSGESANEVIRDVRSDEKCKKRRSETHNVEKFAGNIESASRIKLICRVCGDMFTNERVFQSHYQTHKQASVTTTCTVCGETYDEVSAKAHMEFHNVVAEIVLDSDVDETSFVPADSAGSNGKYSIQDVAMRVTTSDFRTSYTCCADTFSNLYLLHLHTTKIHGYVCYICNVKFPNKQALGGHFRIHNEQKSHQCKDCGKYFAQRGNLLRHTHFVHNCVMPYKCDKCGQRFRRNKYLEAHIRGHTQKYACTECDRVFTELKILRRHKRFHLPRPHQCDLCDTVFTAKSSLVRHKRDIHKMKILGRRSYGFGDVVLGST